MTEHINRNPQRALLALSWAGLMLSALPGHTQPAAPATPNLESAASVTPVPRIARPTLRPDSQGEAVVELQALLQLLGFYEGPVTGTYGEQTQVAVEQFQTAAGLTSDGITGPATWSRLLPAPADELLPPTAAAATAPESAASSPANGSPTAGSTATEPARPAPAQSNSQSQPTEASQPASQPLLRLGAEGEAVSRLQRQLQTLGFYQGAIDGIFGARTEAAVKAAQSSYDLIADGVVGPATWNALGAQN